MLNSFSRTNEFLNNYFYVLKYLTLWIAMLVIFHKYTSQIFNLLFLTMLILIGGVYISFVSPKYYLFRFSNHLLKVDKLMERCFIEFFVHFLMLLFIIMNQYKIHQLFSVQTLNSILFTITYLLIVDVKTVYNIQNIDIINILMFFVVSYVLSTFLISNI